MAKKQYYGNFTKFNSELSGIPAFTLSTDPEHMIEVVGQGFPIAGAIVPSRTYGLDKIEKETDTVVHAYADQFNQLTGRSYFVPMSEDALSRRVVGVEQSFGGSSVYDDLHDPLQTRFSKDVIEHMKEVRDEYGKILVFPYMISKSLKDLEEVVGKGVHVVAPSAEVKEYLADKSQMYSLMQEKGVKTVEGKVVDSYEEAKKVFREKQEEWDGEAFVSAMGGAGGVGCLHARSSRDIEDKFRDYDPDKKLIITKWLQDIKFAPNIMVFIDDEKPNVLMTSDQIIENGTRYNGNSYPLPVEPEMMKTVEEEALKVGEVMRQAGYRGIGGIDGIIAGDEFYYVEINPRKNHSSVVNVAVMEKFRPEGIPPLVQLEAQMFIGDGPKSFDFSEWKKRIEEAKVTFDMYLLKREGWMKNRRFPRGEMIPDHKWDLKTPYFASIPFFGDEEIIIPKSYAALKSDGHTRRVNAVEVARIVSPNLEGRLKQIGRMNEAIDEMEVGN